MRWITALRVASRHLTSRAIQTFSVVSVVAFSVGLAVALFLLTQGLRLGLIRAVEPFELIVGAKGSPYQLVLNTVFLQDVPVGNISWEDYSALSNDARAAFAVPLGFGDSYRGYPVVGTTSGILNIRVRPSDPPWLRICEGRWFAGEGGEDREGEDHEGEEFEAVLGAHAAVGSGLRVGDVFQTAHGIAGGGGHDEKYRVVGIAETVRGPYDRAVFVPLEALWEAHRSSDPLRRREATAILVHPRSYTDAYGLAVSLQGSAGMQSVFPAQTAVRLFSLMGRGEAFLSLVVYAVGGCALLTTLLVLYWLGAARGRERALLHVLGVPRKTLVLISWMEGTITLLAGSFLGELLGRAGAWAAFSLLDRTTALSPAAPLTPQECLAPLVLLSTGSLSVLAVAWGDARAEARQERLSLYRA
ncbi:MAG: ABC transporter permease [Synergistaceae bacterium]|jgi:putative ABC transport system permease protein|nr:ABC transporter permease [Synergistaceae bacterium]